MRIRVRKPDEFQLATHSVNTARSICFRPFFIAISWAAAAREGGEGEKERKSGRRTRDDGDLNA
jgi:hypothetical protein